MKKILIVEDNEIHLKKIIEIAEKTNPNLQILSTGLIEKAIDIAKNNEIEVFFLDIQLTDGNGIELAKRIRNIKKYQFTHIIFITAIPTKEMEAFHDIHSYDYIIKPFTDKDLQKIMKEILIDYVESKPEKEEKKYLSLDFNSIKQRIYYEDILYIEYIFRKITIVTKNEKIQYKHISLKEFKKNFPGNFLQIHQSILVNKLYIKKIDLKERYVFLKGTKKKLTIGSSYKEIAKEILDDIS